MSNKSKFKIDLYPRGERRPLNHFRLRYGQTVIEGTYTKRELRQLANKILKYTNQ